MPVQSHYWLYMRIFALFFLGILITGKEEFKKCFERRDWPMWLFCIGVGVSCFAAIDKKAAFIQQGNLILDMVFLYSIGKILFSSVKWRGRVAFIICLANGFVALWGIAEWGIRYFQAAQGSGGGGGIAIKPLATQMHPTLLSTYLLLTLPFATYFLLDSRIRKKVFGLAVMGMNVACFFLCSSVRAFFALVAVAVFYRVVMKNYKKLLLLFLLFALFLTVASCLPAPYHMFSFSSLRSSG